MRLAINNGNDGNKVGLIQMDQLQMHAHPETVSVSNTTGLAASQWYTWPVSKNGSPEAL